MGNAGIRRFYAPEFLVRDSMRHGELPGTGEAYKTALRVAGPSIAEYFLLALIMIADSIMVSTIGEHAIAAVGLTVQPRFIVQAIPLAINVGITSVTARRRGEEDRQGANSCLKQGLILNLILSVILSTLAWQIARPALMFAGAQADTIEPAIAYFRIILIGLPISSLSLAISASQRGIGKTRIAMTVNMIANVVNVILNYLLIGGNFGFPRLEIRGAAIATVIGWSVGLIIAIISVLHPTRFLFLLSATGWKFEKRVLKSLFKVSSGSFIEQICLRIGFLMTGKIVASLGTILYAAHLIGINILTLSFSVGEGFSVAASSLVGRNLGAKRPDLSILYGKVCQRVSLINCTALMLVFVIFGRFLFSLFSDDPLVLEMGAIISLFSGVIVYGQASQMIYMGSLRGAGDTMYTAMVSMVCVMLVRPIATYLFIYPIGMGLVGAWVGLLVDQFLRLFITWRRFTTGKWISIRL